jgi:hypothetical protein
MLPPDRRLRFELSPIPERLTTCNFMIWVDDFVIWPVLGDESAPLEIQIDDLLAFLTDFWKPLMLRQVYPIDVDIPRPSILRVAAERRWEDMQPAAIKAESRAVANFERAHDLSLAFGGIYALPNLWLMRAQDAYLIEAHRRHWHVPFDDARDALTEAGDWICQRLENADPERWDLALDAWRTRGDGNGIALLAWSAGLSQTVAQELVQAGALQIPQNFNDAANDNDELRLAARMAGALPEGQIRKIIELARKFDHHDAPTLAAYAKECREQIALQLGNAAPSLQGEFAARFLREKMNISASIAVEVFDIARQLGVEIRHERTEPPSLVGLAIWGPKFGPGVFLNEMSTRILRQEKMEVNRSYGARVTMAHEICHLLLDGDHALSAVEILKARMPAGVERRAKSFAGEFLLPTTAAAEHWHNAGRPRNRHDLDGLVSTLSEKYRVTRSVAAWKIQHAAQLSNVDLEAILDSVAPLR